jgi:putative DNA primase/helicase
MQRASLGGADNDGLVQRFQLVVWPNTPKEWKLHDRKPNKEAREKASQIYQRLNNIDTEALGAQWDGDLPYLRFSPEAQEIFNAWRGELEEKIRSGNEPEIIEAHLAKYRSLIPSLALLAHLTDGSPGPVSKEAIYKACGWAHYLESHARKIYAPALNTALFATHSLAKRILNKELSNGFTSRDIYRRQWSGLSSKEEVQEAIETLEENDWIKSNIEKKGGRPKAFYTINPKLLIKGVKND